jgi:hypothetical protein
VTTQRRKPKAAKKAVTAPKPATPETPKKVNQHLPLPANWQEVFVDTLRDTGQVTRACEVARVSRKTAYEYRKHDEAFATAWEDARRTSIQLLEDEAFRRAHDGTVKPIFQGGEEVGTVREYSDTLMIFLLKANDPEKYRERIDIKISGEVVHKVQAFIKVCDQRGLSAGELLEALIQEIATEESVK